MYVLKFVVQEKFTELFCHENCNSIEIFIIIYVTTICIYQKSIILKFLYFKHLKISDIKCWLIP